MKRVHVMVGAWACQCDMRVEGCYEAMRHTIDGADSRWRSRRYAAEKTEENLINLRMKELTAGREIVGQANPEEDNSTGREGRASVRPICCMGFKLNLDTPFIVAKHL